MSIRLHNPHSVLAVLETRPIDVLEIHVQSRSPSPAWERVLRTASANKIRVSLDRQRPTLTKKQHSKRRSPKHEVSSQEIGRSGGSYATVKENRGVDLEVIFQNEGESITENGLYLALDCLQDPHNVGAIFRSAAFFGVKGIVLTKDRSAPMNSAVYDVASGGVEYVPFSAQANLARSLELAKKNGAWILGTSERAVDEFHDIKPDRPWLLVLGNEEKGMRRLTQEKCDVICKLNPQSPVTSLNVAVAAGIFIAGLTNSELAP